MIDLTLLWNSLPALLRGLAVTIQIAILSCSIGLALGVVLGIILSFGYKPLRYLAQLYSALVRGTPMLVQIIFVFYALPQLDISISAYWVAVLVIGFNSAGYVSQTIKSGILSVPVGQIEAAKVLGLNRFQVIRSVILPPAIKTVLPSLVNELVTLIKDTSLASVIGVVELTKEGSIIRSRTYDALTILLAVAIFYLTVTTLISIILTKLEKRLGCYASN
ncbi:MAG: amino acid ABC transporter permease [Chlamydiota bacterium]